MTRSFMGKSNKGVLLVVVGGVALAAGFAAVYFLVLAPRAERKRAQEEVSAWAAKWEAARDCVVGPDPRSADGLEAVLLREALAAPDAEILEELRDCNEEVRALRRGAGYNAGAEIEAAWADLEKHIDKIVEAHALRTAKTPDRPAPELRVMLGEAVAAVDLAYARLRERADMDADHPDGERLPTLPAGRVVADARGTPIAPAEVGVSGSVVWAIGTIGDRRWLVRHASAGAPEVIPIGLETVVGLDGSGWGMWAEEADEEDPKSRAEIRAGALDALGDPAGDGVVIHALAAGDHAVLHAALGRGQTRVVVFETVAARDGTRTAWLARSLDGGGTWPERRPLWLGGRVFPSARDLGLQRLDLGWRDGSGARAWLVVDPSTLDGPLTPAPVAPAADAPCVAGQRAWWVEFGLSVSDAPGEAARPVPGSSDIGNVLACGGDRLVALRVHESVLQDPTAALCRPAGCVPVVIPSVEGSRAAAAVGDKRGPLVAVDTDGVLVLWSVDPDQKQALSPRIVVRLAGDQRLAGIVEWAGTLHLVTRTDTALHIVPLGGGT